MALPDPASPFVWGAGGAQLTPEQIALLRKRAGKDVDTSPVGHWSQGLARVVAALSDGYDEVRAGRAEAANKDADSSIVQALLGGMGGQQFPAAPGGATASAGPSSVQQDDPNVGSTIDFARAGKPSIPSGDNEAFIASLMPAAIEASKRTGVDPRIIVAQAAQETGWGKSAPGNNYFGIKSHGKAGGQTFTTHEVVDGKRVKINDSFRQFASPGDSVAGYADFLLENPRYKPMMAAQGLDAQLQALGASGYATDPTYAASVGSIARGIPMPDMAGAPVQVASLDPSAGVAQATAMPEEYSNMGLSPEAWAGMNAPDGAPTTNPINRRPNLPNADGSFSTELSITVTNPRLNGGRPTNIPSIWGGQRFDPNTQEEEIINQALKSGQQFPSFNSIPEAVSAAEARTESLSAGVPGGAGAAEPQQRVAQALMGNDTPIDQIPVTAGGTAGTYQPGQGGGLNPAIMDALSNPAASEQTRRIAGILLQQSMEQQAQANDPKRALEIQKLQRELNAPLERKTAVINGRLVDTQTGQEVANFPDQPKPTSDIQEYEYAKERGYEGSFVDFQIAQKKAGASSTNVTVGEGNKFYEELDKAQAGIFGGLSEAGVQGRSKLAQIDRLEGLLAASETGGLAMIKQAAGEWGINTEGLSDIQAAQALINELVPQQRQPGSGPMSDADLALFKQSLPRLINQPGGNQTIIDTMRGITQYQIQMGEIADSVADRGMTPAQAREAIRALPNPLAAFGTQKKQDAAPAPAGVDPALWNEMTPEERALWN